MIFNRKRIRKSEIFLTTKSGNFTNKFVVITDETGDKPEEIVDNYVLDTDNVSEILDADNGTETVVDVIDEHLYENLGNVKQENVKEADTDLNDGGTKLGKDLSSKDDVLSKTELLEGMIL